MHVLLFVNLLCYLYVHQYEYIYIYIFIASICHGADLTGCGLIARPDPRCDAVTCTWGTVSHTYSCPDERTCDMDCYGCADGELCMT